MLTTETLTDQELETLLAQVNTSVPSGARNYALLLLMAQTGLRCAEALGLKKSDIKQVTIEGGKASAVVLPEKASKGGKGGRIVLLAPQVVAAIQLWLKHREGLGIEGGLLFCTITQGNRQAGFATDGELKLGQPVDTRYVRDLVKRLAQKAGIDRRVHPHMLRHTALTNLYNGTKDLRLTQIVAGHTTSRMTERYTHKTLNEQAEAFGVEVEEERQYGSLTAKNANDAKND